jgi:LysR family transcriptional regulator, transcriptional activator of the cysJI operon
METSVDAPSGVFAAHNSGRLRAAADMVDYFKLHVFVQAAESLSFSEAAKTLHMTQPTISRHIRALEIDLSTSLFERAGGGLRLTEAGRMLVPRARKLLCQTCELKQLMESLREEVSGEIRVACSTTAGKYILPLVAARFCRQHPCVWVSILRCTAGYVVPQLLGAEADLGVVSREICGPDLECQRFFVDPIILIIPPDHPWANLPQIEPADLIGQPFLIREATSGTRKVMLTELAKHDITLDDMNLFLELGSAEAIVRTVQAGFGISFVSRLAADWALKQGAVVSVPVAGIELLRQIYMVRKIICEAKRAVDTFWGYVHHPTNADLLQLAAA